MFRYLLSMHVINHVEKGRFKCQKVISLVKAIVKKGSARSLLLHHLTKFLLEFIILNYFVEDKKKVGYVVSHDRKYDLLCRAMQSPVDIYFHIL